MVKGRNEISIGFLTLQKKKPVRAARAFWQEHQPCGVVSLDQASVKVWVNKKGAPGKKQWRQ